MKINYTHLCEYATINHQGKPIFIEIFTGIKTPNLPTQKDLYFVANFTISEDTSLEIKLENPSGEKVLSPFKENITPSENPNQGLISKFKNIKFDSEGKYNFKIYANKELVNTTPLTVEKT